MTRRIHDGATLRNAVLAGAALAAALLVVIAVFDAKAAASGWLVGFVFCAEILVGSLTLVMMHRLTGGRWAEIIAPATEPATAAVPLLVLVAIPLFLAIPELYPWLHRPAAIKPDVLSYYLNVPSFIVRSLLALVGWSALAVLLPRVVGRPGQLVAALGLVFHAFVISGVSIDWYLSLEAPFTSSSFGASVAVSSLVAALAWAVLIAPASEGDPAIGDVGGLLLATILGITYIDFMSVLVIWYGDLPYEEIWFVERNSLPWTAVAIAAFLLVSLGPVAALLLAKVRNSRVPLRVVGACVILGLACYDTYLIAPPAGVAALVCALIAVVAVVLALLGLLIGNTIAPSSSRESANVH
jgi:hypothetical protein